MRDGRGFRIAGLLLAATVLGRVPAFAQVDLAGEWGARVHEDQPHRVPGPALGDYTGLPINDAARLKATSWDATILSQPEQQAKPHPAQYFMRGPGPNMRLAKIIDPITQELIGYSLAGTFGRADRVIWLDGRPHPSEYAEHTFAGFSTGEWEGDTLVVTTTHMKTAFIQRNGVPSSYKAHMTEYFFRHGEYLTMVSVVDDPVYLEEPFVRSQTWVWNANQNVGFAVPFEPVDELADKPLGWVPHYPLGTRHTEFADRFGLPFEATQGGKDTLYPEYMIKLKKPVN